MMPYSFIVVNIPLQYRRNNRIAFYCNYRREHFQYRPTLVTGDQNWQGGTSFGSQNRSGGTGFGGGPIFSLQAGQNFCSFRNGLSVVYSHKTFV